MPPKDSPDWVTFDFNDVGTKTSGNYVHLGAATEPPADNDYIGWRVQSFGGIGMWGRQGGLPQASGDAANWIDTASTDADNRGTYRLYSSPGNVAP